MGHRDQGARSRSPTSTPFVVIVQGRGCTPSVVGTENSDSNVLVMRPPTRACDTTRETGTPCSMSGAFSPCCIARIRFLDSAQMLLAQCNVMIDALATDRSDY